MSKKGTMQRAAQRSEPFQNGTSPTLTATDQVTSIVKLSLEYDAVRDSIVTLQSNLPNGALDVVLLSRITQRLQIQALFAVLAERDQLVAQLQDALRENMNVKG